MRSESRLVEALIDERVRVVAALCDLALRDAALADWLGRALEVLESSPEERAALVRDVLARSWARVAAERRRSAAAA